MTTVEQRLGPVTLLINNAAQYRAFGPIGVVDPIAWWNEVEVNLRGPFLYANAVLPGAAPAVPTITAPKLVPPDRWISQFPNMVVSPVSSIARTTINIPAIKPRRALCGESRCLHCKPVKQAVRSGPPLLAK